MKKILLAIIFACLIGLLPGSICEASQKDMPARPEAEKFILDNGMTVLIKDMPANFNVAVYVLVKTGSATEGKYLGTGISHFLEHMIFKGTERRGKGDIGKEVKSLGGQLNGSTSFDYTFYYIDLPKEDVAAAIDILSDMMMNAKIDPQEVEEEREVIFGEVRLYRDRPDRILSEAVIHNAYARHPYRHQIIGYDELLKSVTHEDLVDYYQTHYVPNNMIVSIAGNIGKNEVLATVKAAFKDFEQGAYTQRILPEEPAQTAPRFYTFRYPTELARVNLAYHSVRASDPDLYALDVLSETLGKGKSSRLYQEIKEKRRLVHGIKSSNYTPADPGLFEIEASLEEKNIEETIAAMKKQVGLIQNKGVTKEELEKAKRRARADFIHELENPSATAYKMAIDEAVVGNYKFSQYYVDGIANVSSDDLKRVANEYLIDSNLTTTIMLLEKDEESEPEKRKDRERAEVQRHVLDNGLTVLLWEKHDGPLFTAQAFLKGGTRQETEENNGLTTAMNSTWLRETKSFSSEQLAREVDKRAAGIGGLAGQDTMGVAFSGLIEDLDFGLGVIEEFIKYPRFKQSEFDKSIEEIKSSILVAKDDPFQVTTKRLKETMFKSHYTRLDDLGTEESVTRLSVDDAQDYFDKYIVPNNMVLAVFGDIDPADVLSEIKAKFGKLKPKDVEIVHQVEAAPENLREETIYLNREQAIVMVGFHGPSRHSEDVAPLRLLASVLGSPLSGRMFDKIRDEFGQAYTLGAGYRPGDDVGMIYLYVNTSDENIDKVTDILKGQIADLQNGLVTEDELGSAKVYQRVRYQRALESSYSFAGLTARYETYGMGHDYYTKYLDGIEKATKEDLQRIARKYLNWSSATLIKARPESADPENANQPDSK